MAWFKFGKQDASIAKDAPVETVETMRSRAKRRLIGALVLVVAAVVGFPLLFDTQPRPVLVDVPIEIPDKNKVKPLSPPAARAPASTPAPAAKVDDSASLAGKEEIVNAVPSSTAKSEEKKPSPPATTAQLATKTIANTAPEKKPVDQTAVDKAAADKAAAAKANAEKTAADKAAAAKAAAEKSKADAAKAQALLEGKATPAAPAPSPTAAEGERFIVQFGSFADVTKAREARQKVEKAGLKTYAQIAETSEGKRYRVRVGPFATRAEADKAAAKIKSLDLPANILTL
jgi:DedD protein